MDVTQVFHMNGGADDHSYANNSSVQSEILSITKPFAEQALLDLLNARTTTGGKMGIADLGCPSGPNVLATMSHMLEVVYAAWLQKGGPSLEVTVFLNDLPGNDFNNVFVSLPRLLREQRGEKGEKFGPCFVYGAPGSFYGRLFPSRSLHFVHSSSSLHWLSKVPPGLDSKSRPTLNKGRIHISKSSSKQVVTAYTQQFNADFSSFLESRSREMVAGGKMVLSLMGRRSIVPTVDEDCFLQWELIAQSLMSMVHEGLMEEEKVDSLNISYYPPCPMEIKQVVQTEGSFKIDRIESYEMAWDGYREAKREDEQGFDSRRRKVSRAKKIAKLHRAILEPIFKYHFGDLIMDELFHRYGKMLDSYLAKREPMLINLVVTLVRKAT